MLHLLSVILVLLQENSCRNMLYHSEKYSWCTFQVSIEQNTFGEPVGKNISWNLHLPEKAPAVGLFRYPFNSSHYSVFCSQYWNVTNNMLSEGKLGSNLSSLCVLSRAGGRGKQGFTASHEAVISNSWQSQTKTVFLWLPHCNNRVQRADCLQAKNQRPRNTENSSSQFFLVTKHCCYLYSTILKWHPFMSRHLD